MSNQETDRGSPPDTALVLAASTPDQIAARLADLSRDLEQGYAANTRKAWRSDWRVWTDYCEWRGAATVPADLELLRGFLVQQKSLGKKRATLEHYLATISFVHRMAAAPWPLDTFEGRLMWRAIRRSDELKRRQKQQRGITETDVDRMMASADVTTLRDARDVALLRLAYESLYRESELIRLTVEDLEFESDGTVSVILERSKTDQEGSGNLKNLTAVAAEALARWLQASGITTGPIFRGTRRRPINAQPALTVRMVDEIYKRLAAMAGIDSRNISGHSTRIGAAQDLVAGGHGLADIMEAGRWQSERMVARYSEKITAKRSAMNRHLRRPKA